ncbi:MAG: CDP-diacylglycerol--serine O-phosphatidyltransferase, partial [Pseudomonadota bacterium]
KAWFQGLPSPSAAAMVAAFVWLSAEYGIGGFVGLIIAFAVTAMAGVLMVSNLRYYSFKQMSQKRVVPFAVLLLVPLIIALISINPPVVLFLLAFSYALSGPILMIVNREPVHRVMFDDDLDEDDSDDNIRDLHG